MKILKYTVIGGDMRSLRLAEILRNEGNEVYLHGFDTLQTFFPPAKLETALKQCDAVIGPIPCSKDDININMPYSSKNISFEEVFEYMAGKKIFFAGAISKNVYELAEKYNVKCIDLLQREEMAVLNAIPTAEGAIQISMEKLPITLHGSKVLVLGYGRIGKILSKMLAGLGAKVYVEARKYSDLAMIKSTGYHPVPLDELENYLSIFDVIYNTIPFLILREKQLHRINKDCLIIDLASKPGGTDFMAAERLGLKYEWALSLPGKVAPLTAANYIKETVYNVLMELGV